MGRAVRGDIGAGKDDRFVLMVLAVLVGIHVRVCIEVEGENRS